MSEHLTTLYEHIDDIEIAMLTTRRPDGHLESRAMATQKRAAGADLWFVTLDGARKLRDIAADPHVNLSYYKDRTREWVSVSGIASITRDMVKDHMVLREVDRVRVKGKREPQRIFAQWSSSPSPSFSTGPKLFGNTSKTELPSSGTMRVSLHSSKP